MPVSVLLFAFCLHGFLVRFWVMVCDVCFFVRFSFVCVGSLSNAYYQARVSVSSNY